MTRFACRYVSLLCAGALAAACGSGRAEQPAENTSAALQDASFGPDPCSVAVSAGATATSVAVWAATATGECALGTLVFTAGTGEEICLIPAIADADAGLIAVLSAGTATLVCAKAKPYNRAGDLSQGVAVAKVDRWAEGKSRCTEDTLARFRDSKKHYCSNPSLPLSCDSAKHDLGLDYKGLSGPNPMTIEETIAYCAEVGARLSNGA